MTRPVLLIGGMDSSGGAGLARDLLAVHDAGLTAHMAVTIVTAQTDRAVLAVEPVSPTVLIAQIDAALEDGVGAVKIGAMGNAAFVRIVAARLPDVPVVLDPVLCSSSGHTLLEPAGIRALLEDILPHTTVLTPNLPELATLGTALGFDVSAGQGDVVAALLAQGCQSVLVKGGHDHQAPSATDILYQRDGLPLSFGSVRYPFDLRGTGCQLASGLAAGLAQGNFIPQAVRAARAGLEDRFRMEQARLSRACSV
ncbi:bifunctional hydroxymethylpyrimidine kinase/phosphomethylpyrimidine kinase [Gluconobacter kanchanaburiensis]|uniref:hydroxymethylpyrimidine kinase n=1 Tax=Gluconobacter kanchanaburiensis NBRC 103587 TaxID=1307948 RepID=A0A511BCB8_9PROT|nr:bifunctional hydroxymethylpyrimidine kinase/phosphomethylpyrimidine kinase [Gluconobacter kanchanaburiensis]MBF0862927.1 hydroxymethylpyrimidine/phosphomethylpyrimidine kinase [Gluconobacter kanchanaburiensis]GBR69140.1 phosphomethylpyrimidine kinase ThiD [Gluconobacter kanchanaburiensis NBRC 103587]GEK97253.1 hydroxymethylpyrimidine/phosphomethylpyrimidine kinase [Gluconobacter kanchanaburiensis NBRC 103587]